MPEWWYFFSGLNVFTYANTIMHNSKDSNRPCWFGFAAEFNMILTLNIPADTFVKSQINWQIEIQFWDGHNLLTKHINGGHYCDCYFDVLSLHHVTTTSLKIGYRKFYKTGCAIFKLVAITATLRWRHNGRDGVSNHQPHHYLLNRLFRRRSKKASKLCVTGLCARNSPGTGEFPAQMASNAGNIFIWWRHHEMTGYQRGR